MSEPSDTLCGCDSSTSRQWQNQHSLLAPSWHLLWSQHHPGCSPSASSNAPGEFVGSCLGLRVTLKQILLGGSAWWHPPNPRNELTRVNWKVSSSPANTSQSARAERRDSPWKPHKNNHQTGTLWLCQDIKLSFRIQQSQKPPNVTLLTDTEGWTMIKDLRTQISTPVCAGDVDTHELFLLSSLKKVPC